MPAGERRRVLITALLVPRARRPKFLQQVAVYSVRYLYNPILSFKRAFEIDKLRSGMRRLRLCRIRLGMISLIKHLYEALLETRTTR